jgi:hypothetical protein
MDRLMPSKQRRDPTLHASVRDIHKLGYRNRGAGLRNIAGGRIA